MGELEQAARVELAMHLKREAMPPREKASSINLSILLRGVAAKSGNVLTPGPRAYWGEDMIVSSRALRDLRPASTLTYVEIAMLSRASLDEVLSGFPLAAASIRQAAMKVAMRRAVVVVSKYHHQRKVLSASAAEGKELKAHAALVSAFVGEMDDPEDDPTMLLSFITGAGTRTVVEGEILEEEAAAPAEVDANSLREEVADVKQGAQQLKGMMSMLMAKKKLKWDEQKRELVDAG